MSESSPNKVAHVNEEDMISELPIDITDIIINFLPIRDVVRTSVLANKWRDRWCTSSHLVFDDQFVCSMTKMMTKLNCIDPKLQAYKFISVIDKLILSQRDNIHKFALQIPSYHFQVIDDFIDQWMLLLARRGIKELTIDNPNLELCKLDCHFYICKQLTYLKLRRVHFGCIPPAFEGFYLSD